MASRPRSVSFSKETTRARYPVDISSSPSLLSSNKRRKMSLSQTYAVAHTARAKLAREASRSDHNLRRLVGHANMLDSLMCELAEAESEQERWFHDTVSVAVEDEDEDEQEEEEEEDEDVVVKAVEWTDAVVEEPAEDWDPEDADSDSDPDSDVDDDEVEVQQIGFRIPPPSLSRSRSSKPALPARTFPPSVTVTVVSIDGDDGRHLGLAPDDSDDEQEYPDDEELSGELALVRMPSHPPPELLHDSSDEDDSSDDDDAAMPPSPPQAAIHDFSEADRKAISTTSYYDAGRRRHLLSRAKPSDSSAAAAAADDVDGDQNPPSLFGHNYLVSSAALPRAPAIAAC